MARWDFKAVDLSGGTPRLVDLPDRQASRIYSYEQGLIAAAQSEVAHPWFSGYSVKTSLRRSRPAAGGPVSAGNIEYGLCQAIHGEETAVAAFRSRCDQARESGFIVAFTAHAPGNIPKSCGNCRDILRDTLGTDIDIVHGHPTGGIAVVVRMEQYLVGSYQPLRMGVEVGADDERLIRKIWQQGQRLTNDAFSPDDACPERKYAVMIETEFGRYFGGRQVYCDYHPLYAIRDAIRAAECAGDTALRSVWVVCQNDTGLPADVMYKDRQHLHCFNMQAEIVGSLSQDPSVSLATLGPDGQQITSAWRTTVKTWLPLAFSARNFADMAKLEQYYKKKFR
jgi:cytidine deaminase